ncbi:MAG TPA: hypothetical protein VFA18_06670, partial [Gemmataceae bacterium]|nr:hypothetical protein [Gemmataceae bacterium]
MMHHTGSRRRFLQWTGATAVALASADHLTFAGEPAHGVRSGPHREGVQLGVTSYSFRQLPLDEAIALTRRLGLKHFSVKAFHLPLNASPERITEVAAKIRHAGLDLYGAGVISMHKPADVTQGFAYAKAAGLRVIMAMPTAALLPLIEQNVKEHNIAVAIHNHGPEDRNFPTPESVFAKVQHLDRRIGLCIDVGHTV